MYARKRIQGLQSTKNGIEKFLRLTDKGVYTSTARSLILHLRQLGCPGKVTGAALDAVIQTITSFLGMDRRKRRKKVVSARTVGRIVTEAGVMLMIQLGYDLKQCNTFTSGGDGTTNKHENFDATNINVASQTMQSSEFDTEPMKSIQHDIRLWVWAGCGMHKDLNAVKGGDSAMRTKWIELGVSPISLPNKKNAAVLEALGPCNNEIDGEEIETDMDPFNASATAAESAAMLQSHRIEGRQRGEAQQQHHLQNSSDAFVIAHGPVRMVVKQAKESTQGGAVKFLILLGMYVNHKDDKKGQQHTF
ncbi:hypothetical protein ACEPAI_1293 [Sanghuangporus weigelae]